MLEPVWRAIHNFKMWLNFEWLWWWAPVEKVTLGRSGEGLAKLWQGHKWVVAQKVGERYYFFKRTKRTAYEAWKA